MHSLKKKEKLNIFFELQAKYIEAGMEKSTFHIQIVCSCTLAC